MLFTALLLSCLVALEAKRAMSKHSRTPSPYLKPVDVGVQCGDRTISDSPCNRRDEVDENDSSLEQTDGSKSPSTLTLRLRLLGPPLNNGELLFESEPHEGFPQIQVTIKGSKRMMDSEGHVPPLKDLLTKINDVSLTLKTSWHAPTSLKINYVMSPSLSFSKNINHTLCQGCFCLLKL